MAHHLFSSSSACACVTEEPICIGTCCAFAVGGHLLSIDLATMMDPRISDTLDKVKQDCERCRRKVAEHMLTVKE